MCSAPDDDDENEHGDYKRTHRAALELLGGNPLDEEVPKKGLFALPFIRKSMDRRRLRARAEAEEVLTELAGGAPEENEAHVQAGRLEFSGKKVRPAQTGADRSVMAVCLPFGEVAAYLWIRILSAGQTLHDLQSSVWRLRI